MKKFYAHPAALNHGKSLLQSAKPADGPAGLLMSLNPDHLSLTDFMDLPTLQEIQDSFAAVANVQATITDASGAVLTQPAPTTEFLRRQDAIAHAEDGITGGPSKEGRIYVAPIVVNNQRV